MVFVITIVSLILLFMIVLRYFVIITSPLRQNADKKLANLNLYFSLKMDKSNYSQGEPITLQMGVFNTGKEPIKLQFPTSLDCDFIVEKEYDLFFVKIPSIIWKYSAQVGELQKEHEVTLNPGQVKIFSAQWNQTDFTGKPVKPGKFRITGVMNTKNFKLIIDLRGKTE
jgi:hypothetical protein